MKYYIFLITIYFSLFSPAAATPINIISYDFKYSLFTEGEDSVANADISNFTVDVFASSWQWEFASAQADALWLFSPIQEHLEFTVFAYLFPWNSQSFASYKIFDYTTENTLLGQNLYWDDELAASFGKDQYEYSNAYVLNLDINKIYGLTLSATGLSSDNASAYITASFAMAPEPTSFLMITCGLLGLAVTARRSNK